MSRIDHGLKSPPVRALVLPLVLMCLASLPCQAAMHVDAEGLQRLQSGDVLLQIAADPTGEADGEISAAIEIGAAPAKVFAIMTDCQRALKFVDKLTVCRILERSPDGSYDIREHHSRWLSILPEMVSVFRSDYVPNREIRFKRVKGDIRFLQGAWTLQPLHNSQATLLFYDARVGIDMPIPAFVIRKSLEADVPRLLKSLRAEVMGSP